MSQSKRYPFKFLNSYQPEDKDIFFGRDEEIEALYQMAFQTDLLLVYGASGTGKTSLIQCGLASKFQSYDWFALNIRRGDNINDSLKKILSEAGGSNEMEDSLSWLDDDFDKNSNTSVLALSPLAKSLQAIYLKHFKPVYLIFDQFEELFILGDEKEQDKFIKTIKEILLIEQPIKVIFSIREEYLGTLYEFEKQVPELLRKKLRIEPMDLEKVKKVVKNIGAYPHSLVHLKPNEEDLIAQEIFEKIKGEEINYRTIELPYLQVFLDKLYLQITGDKERKTEAIFTLQELKKIGNIGDVLRDFLDEQVLVIAEKLKIKPEVIWKILSPFVTLDGTKAPLSFEQLQLHFPHFDLNLLNDSLQAIVRSRILIFNEKEKRYEIAHDSLAKQINAKRSDDEIALLEVQRLIKAQISLKDKTREYFTEKQLLFIEPYLDKFKPTVAAAEWIKKSKEYIEQEKEIRAIRKEEELIETKKRLRIVRGLLMLAIIALLTAGYFAWDAQQKKNLAETATVEAQVAKEEALLNLINSYKADIRRLQTRINIAKKNIDSFQQFQSDDDVIQIETAKIDSLKRQINRLQNKIKGLQNETTD